MLLQAGLDVWEVNRPDSSASCDHCDASGGLLGGTGGLQRRGGTMTEPVLSEAETVLESRATAGLC